MSKIKDGGPAFPEPVAVSPAGDVYPSYSGMMLRDYFAAKAMSGWLASFGPEDAVNVNHVAEFAYKVADAMLAAREAKP